MLPASRSGKTRTFALPATSDPGAFSAATDGTSAASSCRSPSTASSGAFSWASSVASWTFVGTSPLAEPMVEKDSMATFGWVPMYFSHDPADAMAISDSSSAVGSMFRPQSANRRVPSSPYSALSVHMMKKADTSFVPGAVFRICSAGRSVLAVEWQAPETRPSASPILTIMVA